jgi:hypothetical protein
MAANQQSKWRPISLFLPTFTHHRLSIYWRILSLSRHAADRQDTFIFFSPLTFFFISFCIYCSSFYLLSLPFLFVLVSFFLSTLPILSFFLKFISLFLYLFISFVSLLVNFFLLFQEMSTGIYFHAPIFPVRPF